MSSRLRWRLFAVLLVLGIFGTVGLYPIVAARYGINSPPWLMDKQLKLGLDLKGGVQLVVRVQTDYVLQAESEQAAARLREELSRRGIVAPQVALLDPTHVRVGGVSTENAPFREAANQVGAGFDLVPGSNGSYVLAMKPAEQVRLRADAVVMTRETIERRVNELGVTEPSISRQGPAGDELLVQLPGVANVDRARAIIQAVGTLEFRMVEQGPAPTREMLSPNGQVPTDMEIVSGVASRIDPAAIVYYLIRKVPAVTGRDLRNARPSLDENSQPTVSFTLNAEGGRKFAKVTAENIGRQLAIVLDGRVQSAPRIDNRISTDASIHGNFTQQEAQDLSLILRTGSLPAPLIYLGEHTIGASLGADSIRSGVVASAVGLLLVAGCMLAYYRLSGLNAVVALIVNLIILLGLMAYVGAVMTLPGIAGFVLTMGIGVDSNVLVFERIKEELEAQRGVRASIGVGFSRVFLTLLDTHIAALISAACLFQFGTGPIRGFAVTLSIGLISNLFTATFVSKTLFELVLARRRQVTTLSI
jgi:preprotein translocase subunit SecD